MFPYGYCDMTYIQYQWHNVCMYKSSLQQYLLKISLEVELKSWFLNPGKFRYDACAHAHLRMQINSNNCLDAVKLLNIAIMPSSYSNLLIQCSVETTWSSMIYILVPVPTWWKYSIVSLPCWVPSRMYTTKTHHNKSGMIDTSLLLIG